MNYVFMLKPSTIASLNVADEDNDGVCDQLEEAECENLAIDSIWTNLESGVYPTVNEIQLGIETELSFAFSLCSFQQI